ncbi:stemmadenine O-acetyltransferase-like [Humulus lupulus]|uniref:stemmadenine O-acetyltransferase-like n=1 Tax=Humulus lupulus TaxID=3486 RepID=UPI002B40FB0A|nr:stemmadenine O-acetyltransferase-like [Humulus lupulus]
MSSLVSKANYLRITMKVEVEVISKEIIKPSNPTPHHRRHYELSLLDQQSPKTYNPLVFFYELDVDYHQHQSNLDEISNKIKSSLSEALTLFYPLAGRVKNDRFVDCNDEGVHYSVARVNSPFHISDAIEKAPPGELCKFLPFGLHPVSDFSLGVQLNIFERGGIAVGLCISHQLTDALSCIVFVKTWVAISRRGKADDSDHQVIVNPEFNSASLFRPKDDPEYDGDANISKMVVSKRFVFDASAIEAIRSKYDEGRTTSIVDDDDAIDHRKRPTRVEALSAFILSRLVAVTSDEHAPKSKKSYMVVHAVNARPRFEPPLPDHSFGNLSRCGFGVFSGEEKGFEVVRKIRRGIRQVNMEYLKKVQQGSDSHFDAVVGFMRTAIMEGGQPTSFIFTSLCRFPLYDADFGWGKPAWVSSATLTYNNLVVFMDTKSGDGIETYIGLKEEHMAKLEADHDFLEAISSVRVAN